MPYCKEIENKLAELILSLLIVFHIAIRRLAFACQLIICHSGYKTHTVRIKAIQCPMNSENMLSIMDVGKN